MSERVVSDVNVCSGKPTVRGTRIMVETLVGMAEGDYTVAQILAAYPELTEEDVRAALTEGPEERRTS